MTGLYLLFVAALWLFIAMFLTKLITTKLPKKWWGIPLRIILFLVLLPLPLADEIIGRQQFEQLCKEQGEVIVDATNIKGKTVWFAGSQRTQIKLGGIHVTQTKVNMVDANTQELIYHYYRLEANGGLFMSFIGVSEGGKPLLFGGFCQPKNIERINAELGLTEINRPISNNEKTK